MSHHEKFGKLRFPIEAFNPLQKKEFKEQEDLIAWPPKIWQPKPSPKCECIKLYMMEEDDYLALDEEAKLSSKILWVVYPNDFF